MGYWEFPSLVKLVSLLSRHVAIDTSTRNNSLFLLQRSACASGRRGDGPKRFGELRVRG